MKGQLNWHKLALIIKREFLVRVRSWAFIIATLLGPLAIIVIMGLPVVITLLVSETEHSIAVVDDTGRIHERLKEINEQRYIRYPELERHQIRERVAEGELSGYLHLQENTLELASTPEFYHDGSFGFNTINAIRSELRNAIRDVRLDLADAGEQVRAILDEQAGMHTRTITRGGEEGEDTSALVIVGYIMAFIIYGAMFAYGTIIMRGVIEEKTNRIVEIVASCVKPFELMLGKVLGVGLLGLMQFLIWAVLASVILAAAGPILMMMGFGAGDMDPAGEMAAAGQAGAAQGGELPFTIPSIGIELWAAFIVFFLMGYLIYGALFAAVGSTQDTESDSQQLAMPVFLLIIVPILLINNVANDPTSTLSTVLSIIPFFAPILMPTRLAVYDIPFWEIGLALGLMTVTFLLLIWLSARIYRVGILMYGKEIGFREVFKWLRYD